LEGIPCPNISSFNSLIDKVGNVLRQGAEKLSGFTLSFAAQTAAVTTNYLNFKEQFKQGKEWASNRLYWFNFNIEKENEETGTTFSERLAQDIMLNIETDGVGEMLEEGLEKLLGKGVIKRAGTKKIANEELINEFKKLNSLKPSKVAEATEGRTTVLGSYNKITGGYVGLAKKLGANYFEIPTNIWSKMTPAEQWAANTKFLDRMIARGDNIVLSNSAFGAKAGTSFYKELQYLYSKGYKAAADGMSIIKP